MRKKPEFEIGQKVKFKDPINENEIMEISSRHYDGDWKEWRYGFKGDDIVFWQVIGSELVAA